MSSYFKRKDGFEGEKLISIPTKIWKDYVKRYPALFNLYITHIGYFPKASFHYKERKKGCEDNILIYCLQGKGYYMINDKRFEVRPNQFILLPATDNYMRYWADHNDPWTIYWLHFTGGIIDPFNNSLNISNHKGPTPIPLNNRGLEIWAEIFQSLEMGYSFENICNANFCLYHLISSFLFPDKYMGQEQIKKPDVITETILHMKENVEKKLSVDDMAMHCSLSTSHFSSMFRRATGMPPIDYFIHLKMQRACQLLFNNELKIKDISNMLGYEDPYYFSRVFKKSMGMSPEQYKQMTSLTSSGGANVDA